MSRGLPRFVDYYEGDFVILVWGQAAFTWMTQNNPLLAYKGNVCDFEQYIGGQSLDRGYTVVVFDGRAAKRRTTAHQVYGGEPTLVFDVSQTLPGLLIDALKRKKATNPRMLVWGFNLLWCEDPSLVTPIFEGTPVESLGPLLFGSTQIPAERHTDLLRELEEGTRLSSDEITRVCLGCFLPIIKNRTAMNVHADHWMCFTCTVCHHPAHNRFVTTCDEDDDDNFLLLDHF